MHPANNPFEEGKLAATEGEDEASNPYPPGSPEHRLWLDGFEFVSTYDEDGEIPSAP